jgi:hypothetical protein
MKALDQAVGKLGFVAAIEVIGAEIAVVDVVLEHVIGRGEHGGGDGEDGFFGAAAALEAALGITIPQSVLGRADEIIQ